MACFKVLSQNNKFQYEPQKERNHLIDSGIDGRIILKLILTIWCQMWTAFKWLRMRTSG
jgi:hypothetical protein